MRVIFLPDYGDNAYQESLKKSLQALKIVFCKDFSYKEIFNSSFDIVHIHWPNSYTMGRNVFFSIAKSLLFVFKLAAAKFFGVKIVWTVHNLYNHEKYHYNIEIVFNRIIALLTDVFIVHSADNSRRLADFYKIKNIQKIKVIREGNYSGYYKNEISSLKAREILKIKPEEKVFLFFGNIRKYKGFLTLLDVFLLRKNLNFKLVVAGRSFDKTIASHLSALARKDPRILLFDRFIENDEIQIFMNSADALILPYSQINNSAVLVLAMIFKKAVLCFDMAHMREILGAGGYYAPKDDFDGFLKNMDILSREELNKNGIFNFEKILPFTWEENAKKTFEIYEKLV